MPSAGAAGFKQSAAMYVQAATVALLVRLLGWHCTSIPGKPRIPRGGLSAVAVRRVEAFVQQHMARDIGLDTLADMCHLSLGHFCRAFRQSLGESPHQWLTGQRIRRAKELMASTDLALTAIALACGFSSHSHLTHAFRKLTGTTPVAWRREHRP